jgi:L-rhamnose-H+ transport protein
METMGIGLGLAVLAALVGGSFMFPMSQVKKWSFENTWLLFTLLGMIVINGLVCRWSVPALFEIYRNAATSEVLVPFAFGLAYGVGMVLFGFGITAVGMSIGYAIVMSGTIGFGAFIPMLVLHPQELVTPKGLTVLASMLLMIFSIAVCGRAGVLKDSEQAERTGKITQFSKIGIKLGLLICVLSSILNGMTNVGFALSGNLIGKAVSSGTVAVSGLEGNIVWFVVMIGAFIPNLLYMSWLLTKNKTWKNYFCPEAGRNVGLVVVMAALWIVSFYFYGMSAAKLGSWGPVIGWAFFIGLICVLANVIGIAQGEWKGTSPRTRRVMGIGLALLVATLLVQAGSSLM